MVKLLIDLAGNLVEGAISSFIIFLLCSVSLAVIVGLPVLVMGLIYKLLCIIFALRFNWSLFFAVAFLALCLIVTAQE